MRRVDLLLVLQLHGDTGYANGLPARVCGHSPADGSLKQKDVALEVGDIGVRLDHLGESVHLIEEIHLIRIELLVGKEEPIPIAKPGELIDQDRLE